MDVGHYADELRAGLVSVARWNGPEAEELLDRLAAPLEAAFRLVLQEAVSDAAQEISRELAPGSVDVRLRGRDLGFVVTPAPAPPQDLVVGGATPRTADGPRDPSDGGTARLTVRLAEQLKADVEAAAELAGMSVNAYLVRRLSSALQSETTSSPWRSGDGNRLSGWAQ